MGEKAIDEKKSVAPQKLPEYMYTPNLDLVSQPKITVTFGEDTQCLVSKCAGQAFHKFILPALFEPPPKSIFFNKI